MYKDTAELASTKINLKTYCEGQRVYREGLQMGIQFIASSFGIKKSTKANNKTQAKANQSKLTTSPNITATPTALNLQAYHMAKSISFGRTLAVHKSWGASLKKDGTASLKLFTFPDVYKVYAEIRSAISKDPVHDLNQEWPEISKHIPWNQEAGAIRIDRTHTGEVLNIHALSPDSKLIELKNKGEGVFESHLYSGTLKDGDKYRFLIVKGDNTVVKVKDPYSMKQDSIFSWSTAYDHNKYKWTDHDWMANKISQKISRRSKENKLTSPANLRIYEANIATLTKDGTFEAAKKVIDKLAMDKKFNTLHIMPVEGTYGVNWGYDGVDKFAPSEHLGGPDGLKSLIDYAHKKKINVIMDIVPNHIGTDGNFLSQTGPYANGGNGFGDAFNYEKENSKHVRDYMVNASLNWIQNYHCDGLRVDMTKFMDSDYTMKQMASEIHYHCPDAILIAEDGRENAARVTNALSKEEECIGKSETDHAKFIDVIDEKVDNVRKRGMVDGAFLSNLGFDSEWDFPFHKQIASAVLGEWEIGQYKRNMGNLSRATYGSVTRVKYPMSHDEIGNWDGTRLMTKIATNDLNLYNHITTTTNNPAVEKGQKAAHAAQRLLESFATGHYEKMNDGERTKFLQGIFVNKDITTKQLSDTYEKAFALHKTAEGKVFTTPGPKMIFQGDDNTDLSYFKFFRNVATGYEKDLESKGYKPGIDAFNDSKLEHLSYSDKIKQRMAGAEKYTNDLNELVEANPALQDGYIAGTVEHEASQVHAVHCKKDNNEIYSIANFKNESYDGNYKIHLPEGKWQEVINSNDQKYGGDGKNLNTGKTMIGNKEVELQLPANGLLVFQRVI